MPEFPFGEPVTVTPRVKGDRDDSGNDTFVDGEPVTYPLCAVWPRTATETRDQLADAVSVGISVLVPPGAAVDAYSRVTVRGLPYEVTGEPQVYRSSLTGTDAGVLLQLDRVTG